MEAHKVLQEAGFNVVSYGVGTCVRLPGPNAYQPNVYEFGTPYRAILADLRSKPASDQPHYERLGLISMLERNMRVKLAPEKWQLSADDDIDVVVTFEERVMDLLLENMASRSVESMRPVLVVNLEVPDNNREALAAAPQVRKPQMCTASHECVLLSACCILPHHNPCCMHTLNCAFVLNEQALDLQALTLARTLQDSEDWIGDAPEILSSFEQNTRRKTLFSYVFF